MKNHILFGILLSSTLLTACATSTIGTVSTPDTHLIRAKITSHQLIAQSAKYQYVFYGLSAKDLANFKAFIQNYEPHLLGGYVLIQENKHSIYGNQFNNQFSIHYHIIINEKSLTPTQKHTLTTIHRAKPYPSKNIYNPNTDKQLQVKFKAEATRYLIDNLPKNEQLGDEYTLAKPIALTHIGQNNHALQEAGAVILMPVYVIMMMFGCMTGRCI